MKVFRICDKWDNYETGDLYSVFATRKDAETFVRELLTDFGTTSTLEDDTKAGLKLPLSGYEVSRITGKLHRLLSPRIRERYTVNEQDTVNIAAYIAQHRKARGLA